MIARAALLAVVVAGASIAPAARACGYCIEDRMAAVYDHGVLTRASAAGHKVAFFAVLGAPPDGAAAEALRRELGKVSGVDRDSVRYSADLASMSLSFDPRSASYARLERGLAQALAPKGLTLGLIDIVERPEQIRAARRGIAAR